VKRGNMGIVRINHAVLYVRDARRQARFYEEVLGFETIIADPEGHVAFMRTPDSDNDHDIGFMSVGTSATLSAAGRTSVGLYHLAWEVPTLRDLATYRERLLAADAFVGESDHGVTKALYAFDPDEIEFELMWLVPPELYDPVTDPVGTRPLNLTREIERFGSDTRSSRNPLPVQDR